MQDAHNKAYSQGNASGLDAGGMGAAAAMQAFKMFTSGGGQQSSSGGGKSNSTSNPRSDLKKHKRPVETRRNGDERGGETLRLERGCGVRQQAGRGEQRWDDGDEDAHEEPDEPDDGRAEQRRTWFTYGSRRSISIFPVQNLLTLVCSRRQSSCNKIQSQSCTFIQMQNSGLYSSHSNANVT